MVSPAHIAHSFHGYPEVRHLIHEALQGKNMLPLPNKKSEQVNPPRSSRRPPPQASECHETRKMMNTRWRCSTCSMNINSSYPNLILLYQRADPSCPQCRKSSQESVILRFDSNSSLLNLNWVGDRDKYNGHSRTGSNCNKIIQNLSTFYQHHECRLNSLVSSCSGH